MTPVEETRRWVERIVIGLQLCPFAHKPHQEGRVRYLPSQAGDDSYAVLAEVWAEIERLQSTPTIETTLLILPTNWDDFDDYLDLIAAGEALLERAGVEGDFQLASFHPNYQFEGVPADDPANETNRSPYPIVHLLRAASVAAAIASHPDIAGVPARNIALLRQIGVAGLQARLGDAG